jgi:hypothetical protein
MQLAAGEEGLAKRQNAVRRCSPRSEASLNLASSVSGSANSSRRVAIFLLSYRYVHDFTEQRDHRNSPSSGCSELSSHWSNLARRGSAARSS